MASVSSSHLIIFIASLLVAASVAGTVTDSVSELGSALEARSLDESAEIRTDVEVISDPASPVYNRSGDENVTLLVKNTGVRELPADGDKVDLILDGEYRTGVNVTVVDGADWSEGNVARVTVEAPGLDAGDHRVKLILNGDEEVFEFRT
ncbi:MAG: flagellar protein G [Halobacteriaceae archaeon]